MKKISEIQRVLFFQRLHAKLKLNYGSSVDNFSRDEIMRYMYNGDTVDSALFMLYDKYSLNPLLGENKFTSDKVMI